MGDGQGGDLDPTTARGEERAGCLWRDKVGGGGRVAVKGRWCSSDSCSVVIKIHISTHTVCSLSRGVTSDELSPEREPPGDFHHFPVKLGSIRLFTLKNEPELLEALK